MKFRFKSLFYFCGICRVFSVFWGARPAEAQCGHILLADDGAAGDNFGIAVSIDGTTAIVGAEHADANGLDSGAAYLFDTITGQQNHKLLPIQDSENIDDHFGGSVAISGSTAIVGARNHDEIGLDSGAAYVFDTATGVQTHKLLPDELPSGQWFGRRVAIDGTVAIVGAWFDNVNGEDSGSVYVFHVVTGQRLHKLLAADGTAYDRFGSAVAISGTIAVVGAVDDSNANGQRAGSAYLFDVDTGLQLFKLLADDGHPQQSFAYSVDIDENVAIVGAYTDDDNGHNSGSAYLFDTTTGQQLSKLLANDGAASDEFGWSVGISGTVAVVGAPGADTPANASGAVYFFDVTTGQQIDKIIPEQGESRDFFGHSVATQQDTCFIIGVPNEDDNGTDSGSAYTSCLNCGPVCPGDGTLIEGFGETGDFSVTCGSDDTYWAAHGASLFFQISDPVVQFELTATAPAGFAGRTISVDIEASKLSDLANLNLRALLFNFTTGSYVPLPGIMPLATSDSVRNFTLPVGSDPADFIESGTYEVRLLLQTIQTSGLPNVRTQLDQVLFNFE